MEELDKRALHAFEKYLTRGVAAREAILAGNIEQAIELLRLRKAAFHNFCALDFLAQKNGYAPEQDQQLQEMVRQAEVQNDALAGQLGDLGRLELGRLKKVQSMRSSLRGYLSGALDRNGFEHSI